MCGWFEGPGNSKEPSGHVALPKKVRQVLEWAFAGFRRWTSGRYTTAACLTGEAIFSTDIFRSSAAAAAGTAADETRFQFVVDLDDSICVSTESHFSQISSVQASTFASSSATARVHSGC